MKNKLINLIDFDKVNVLLEGFNKSTGFVTAILDLEGNVLSKSGWRQICTEFHRVHPETAKKCTISDTELAGRLAKGEKYHFYKCLNGLVDVAVPVVIKGEHIANLFSGQFFFEKPDLDYFIKQAKKYKFDNKNYLEALEKVPVISEDKVKIAMEFLLNMTDLIVEMTQQRMEQIELNESIKKSEKKFRNLFENSQQGKSMTGIDGSVSVNKSFCNIIGYSEKELKNKKWMDFTHPDDIEPTHEVIKSLKEGKQTQTSFEKRYIHKNGTIVWVEGTTYLQRDDAGNPEFFMTSIMDITARKQAEELIIKQRRDFQAIINAAPIMIAYKDVDNHFVHVNSALADFFDLPIDQIIGKTPFDLIKQKEVTQQAREQDLEIMRTGNPVINQLIKWSGGNSKKEIWALYSKVPFYNEDGNCAGILNFTVDVNDRILAEEALKESEKRFKMLFEKAPLGYQSLDENGYFIEVNQTWVETLGYTKDEVIGKWFGDFLTPDYTEGFRKRFPIFKAQGSIHSEFEMVKKDGTVVFIAFEGRIGYNLSGEFQQTHCVLSDITESRRAAEALAASEKEFRQLAESMPQIVWITEADGNNIYFNQQWVDYTGLSLEESYGAGWNKPFHPDDQQRAWDAWQNAVNDNGIYSLEVRLRRFDGEYFWWLVRGVPMINEKGGILKWFGTCTDIEEIKKSETALKESEKAKSGLLDKLNEAQKVAQVGSWEWDLKNNKFWGSDEVYRIYEVTKEEFTPGFDAVQKFIHPDELSNHNKLFEHSIQTGEPLNFDFRLVTRNGEIKYCNARGKIVCDNFGNHEKFVGTVADNTVNMQTQLAQQESEKHYQSLFENMLNGLAFCQMHFDEKGEPYDFTYLSVNSAFEAQTGLKNVEGKKVSEVIPGIRTSDPKLFELYGRVAKTGIPERFEFYVESLNMWFWLSVYSPEKGYFVAVFDVITERKLAEEALKESEAKYKGLYNSIRDALLIADTNRKIIDCNPAFTSVFGYTLDEITGKQTLYVYENEEEFNALEEAIKKHANDNSPFQYTVNYKKKDGEIFPGETGIYYLKNNKGEVIGFIELIRDITQRLKTEEDIKTLNEELEQKVKNRTLELEKKFLELERLNKLFVDRELRMIELKQKIKKLENERN